MNKTALLLSIAVFLACCSSGKLTGTYGYRTDWHELYVLHDSTFVYKWYWGGLGNRETTKGTWKFEDGYLVLNSTDEREKNKFEVRESNQGHPDSIYFEIREGYYKSPLFGAFLLINDSIVLAGLGRDTTIKNIGYIRNIEISFWHSIFPKYNTLDSNANHYLILIYRDLINTVYFEDVKVKIKGNKAISINNPIQDGRTIIFKRRRR